MLQAIERAATSDSAVYTLPKLSPDAFLGTIWAITVLSFMFLPARLYARWKTLHHFCWDDFFVIAAWVLSLIITILVTIFMNVTYEVMLVRAHKISTPPNIKTITMQSARTFSIVPMIFYTGLWCVKVAFLIFFRRFGLRAAISLRRWWMFTACTTAICYCLCFALLPYHCLLLSYEVFVSPACQTQGLSFISMWVNCAIDILTDCLIVSIPFLILWRVRISTRQKAALSAVFSLVVITITFAIVRAMVTTVGVKKQIDRIWMYLWTSMELNIAIIIACVAPYRTLFIRAGSPEPPLHRLYRPPQQTAFKLYTTTDTRTSRASEEIHRPTIEMRDLEHCASFGGHADATSSLYSNGQSSEQARSSSPRDESWATLYLTQIDPWYDIGGREQIREFPEILSPVPKAHLETTVADLERHSKF